MKSEFWVQDDNFGSLVLSRRDIKLFIPKEELYGLIITILSICDDEFLYRAIKKECESKLEEK